MQNGDGNHLPSRTTGNDGQHHVHRIDAGRRNGCQLSEELRKERTAQQRHHLAENIGKQGDGAQFGSQLHAQRCFLELRDEDGRQRIVGKAAAHRHTVEYALAAQQHTGQCGEQQCPDDSGQRYGQHPDV